MGEAASLDLVEIPSELTSDEVNEYKVRLQDVNGI